MDNQLRKLPAVSRLLAEPQIQRLSAGLPHHWVVDTCRASLTEIRTQVQAGNSVPSPTELLAFICRELQQLHQVLLQPVINATGVLIHTNLGRSPLPKTSLEKLAHIGSGYLNLEFDLVHGKRGDRYQSIEKLLNTLTNAEASIVVNNNAAAVLLVLKALAPDREVIVSRGELVEIGGGFRVPEVMEESGCILKEVGTTNKTRVADYEKAITSNTVAILKVHPSNYTIQGFVESATREELAPVCAKHNLLLLEDLGSGSLISAEQLNSCEPLVDQVVKHVDVVTYSGDKLLGGPQAGIISGRKSVIDKIRRQPLLRALRLDKLSLIVLEDILLKYATNALTELPLWNMSQLDNDTIKKRALDWQQALGAGWNGNVRLSQSTIGGGSVPGETIPTWVLALSCPEFSPEQLADYLRKQRPAIIGRIQNNLLLLDPRTVLSEQDQIICEILSKGVSRDVCDWNCRPY